MRLKSSSIYYALFLSVIIGFFLGGMILFAGVNKRFESFIDKDERLRNNAYSGIEYGMANFQELGEENIEVTLFNDFDSVRLSKGSWGSYTVITSIAHSGALNKEKSVLTGKIGGTGSPSLFLVDQGDPLSVCGETRLEGKCLLPKSGIKRAYLNGRIYKGDRMVYGTQGVSESKLPAINETFLSNLKNTQGEVQHWTESDSIAQTFADPALQFIADGTISLKSNSITGHVYIESGDSIFIGADAELDQIIVKSRVVYIEKGFEGSLQIYASERIILEEGVHLLYPSVLGIIEETTPDGKSAEIVIDRNSQLIGSVLEISESQSHNLQIQILIEQDARVDGLVYNEGSTQVNGTVNGSLYTKSFFLKLSSSGYYNHLLNATIKNDLPKDFVFIPIMESNEPLTKIQWLQ